MRRLLGDASGQLRRAEELVHGVSALRLRRGWLRTREGRAHHAHEVRETGGIGRVALHSECKGRHQRREGALRVGLRQAELTRRRIHPQSAIRAHQVEEVEQCPLPRSQGPTIGHACRRTNAPSRFRAALTG